MTFFSQLDPRFASAKIGKTFRTIRDFGCTITDIGMVVDKDPVAVNKALIKGNGYVGSLVNWERLQACIPQLKFIYRYRKYDNAVAIAAIKKYGFCLAEVDFDGNPRTEGKHWVVLLGNRQLNDPLSRIKHPEKTNKYALYTGLCVLQRV